MPEGEDDDRQLLRDIRAYCLSRYHALRGPRLEPEAQTRRRAYAAVARAAREELEEMDA
jgi:hypothetical protein